MRARRVANACANCTAPNPAARIAATGCWVSLEPQAALTLPGVTLAVENTRKDLLHLLLEPWSAELDDPAALARMQPNGNPFELANSAALDDDRMTRTRAFIKVQDGCNNRCTFCVVTLARGASRSRSLREIVAEVQAWAERRGAGGGADGRAFGQLWARFGE